MLRDEVRRRTDASFDLLRSLPGALASGGGTAGARLASLAGFLGAGVRSAAETPLNGPVGPHRRVEWLEFDLGEMKEVKKRLGGTLNDVVLATVAGAMRRYLGRRGAACEGEFRALIPVSTRTVDESGSGGNRVSAWIAPLPLDEMTTAERDRTGRHENDLTPLSAQTHDIVDEALEPGAVESTRFAVDEQRRANLHYHATGAQQRVRSGSGGRSGRHESIPDGMAL